MVVLPSLRVKGKKSIMKKIKIQNKRSFIVWLLLILLLFLSIFMAIAIKNNTFTINFLLLISTFIIAITRLYPNKINSSDIKYLIINDDCLMLEFMSKNTVKFSIHDVSEFKVSAYIFLQDYSRLGNINYTDINIFVKTKNGKWYNYENHIEQSLFRQSYKCIYDLIKFSNKIPRFNLEISGNNCAKPTLYEIDYYKKYRKKVNYKEMRIPKFIRVLLYLFAAILAIFIIGFTIYCFLF